jgi:phosphoribosyl 1,2-cyclic phosphodiesterase
MSKLYYKNGEIQKVNCGNGTEMIFAKGSSTDDFLAYCAELSANGYAKVMQREIVGNVFAAFKGEEEYIYAYYTAYSGAVRTVHGPLSSYGDEDCGVLEEICTPELCAVGQPDFMNCGQGYIYRLADGRFLVHDGGCKYDCRPDFMYDAIKELATDKNNIVIAAWFISHPHADHQDAFEEFIENHGGDINVRIERVIFNFADADMYTYMRKDNQFEDCKGLVDRIYTKCETYIPEAQLIKAHTGQIFRFGECKVEVLYTVEDVLPVDCFDYVNGTSIVIRVTVDGQSAMLLADTTHTSGRILENMFGDFLKSDMVQLAHHGMWASYPSLYEHVAASIVLWPNVERFAKDWLADKPIATAIGLADDVYISGSGNTVLSLPHTLEGNKAAVIEMLKSL